MQDLRLFRYALGWAFSLALLVAGCDDGGAGGGAGSGGDGGDGGNGGPAPQFAYVVNIDDMTVSQFRVGMDGALEPLVPPTIETGNTPISIAAHPSGRFLYVTNSDDANVSQYRVGEDGTLSVMSPPRAASGVWPYSIAIEPSGKFAYVANDFDDTISQYSIGEDGTLEGLTPRTVDAPSGAISIAVEPTGSFVYVASRYGNVVSQYGIGSDGALEPLSPSTVEAGEIPIAIAADPSGRFVYVANDRSDDLSQYSINGDGTLSALSPARVDLDSGLPHSVTVDPLGRAVYVGYVLSDAASHHQIATDGTLSSLNPPVTGAGESSYPADVAVDPSGGFAYITNAGFDTISSYRVEPNGALSKLDTEDVATGAQPGAMLVMERSGGAGGAGGSGAPAKTATIGGKVFWYNFETGLMDPVDGATVSVAGAATTATSDRNGDFWIEAPLGPGAIYATAPGYWGLRTVTDVTATGSNRYALEVLEDEEVEGIVEDVGLPLDASKGVVLVDFGGRYADGGESADLGVGYGYSVVYDEDDVGMLGNELIAGGYPGVVFANVEPSEDVMLSATDEAGDACPQDPAGTVHAAHPKVVTEIDVVCPESCPPEETCVPCSKTQRVSVGCTNSVANILADLPYELSVDISRPIFGGLTFSATFGGTAVFPEPFYDIAQSVVPGGVREVFLEAAATTVAVRSGAAGPEVTLGFDESALVPGPTNFCTELPVNGKCDPANDLNPADPSAGNSDCTPMFDGNYCDPVRRLLVDIPTSSDCCALGAGCTCDQLGKNEQCEANGFCVTGSLYIPLESATADYTADESGEVLFGWWENPATDPVQPSTLSICTGEAANDDARCVSNGGELPTGSYALPIAVYSNPVEPVGIRANLADALFAPFQCAMAVDGGSCSITTSLGCLVDADCPPGESCNGIGEDDNVIMPTPDDRMLSCPIY